MAICAYRMLPATSICRSLFAMLRVGAEGRDSGGYLQPWADWV